MLDGGLKTDQPPVQDILHEVVQGARHDNSEWVGLLQVLQGGGFNLDYQVSWAGQTQRGNHSCAIVTGDKVFQVMGLTPPPFPPCEQNPPSYQTVLHVACERGLLTMVEALLDLGADINAVAEVRSGMMTMTSSRRR
jgi:hypothetical protein